MTKFRETNEVVHEGVHKGTPSPFPHPPCGLMKSVYKFLCLKDPNLLSQLDADDLAALSELSSAELAPPPSNEEVFGEKMEALKKEFEQDKERSFKYIKKLTSLIVEMTILGIDVRRAVLGIK
jgi:hypothetical protein